MEKELLKKVFDAARETEYFYDKSGVSTGYYPKWDSFDEWYEKVVLPQADVSGQVCGTCGSKDVTDWNTYYRCNECDSKC